LAVCDSEFEPCACDVAFYGGDVAFYGGDVAFYGGKKKS
jgi:hypothetical protein